MSPLISHTSDPSVSAISLSIVSKNCHAVLRRDFFVWFIEQLFYCYDFPEMLRNVPNKLSLHEVLSKNFPTNGSFVIFLLYMAMFVAQVPPVAKTIRSEPFTISIIQGMLVTASRSGGSDYPYNTVTVVLITEVLKLILSGLIYMKDNTAVSMGEGILENKNVLVLYYVPAALYCLYNNLSFVSLSYFNPTTYFMFMQIRLLLTGLIYQVDRRNEIYNTLSKAEKIFNTGPSTRSSFQRS